MLTVAVHGSLLAFSFPFRLLRLSQTADEVSEWWKESGPTKSIPFSSITTPPHFTSNHSPTHPHTRATHTFSTTAHVSGKTQVEIAQKGVFFFGILHPT